MSKTIFFVRHGESEANAAGLMAGTYDTSLTAVGHKQAQKAGSELKEKNVELIVCSPLMRTRQTAALIAEELGYEPKKIVENELFIERNFGPYEGRAFQEYLDHDQAGTLEDGIEEVEKLHARIVEGFEWLKSRPEKTILIASHGSTGRMVKLVAQNLEHSNFHMIERMGNTEVYEFSLD